MLRTLRSSFSRAAAAPALLSGSRSAALHSIQRSDNLKQASAVLNMSDDMGSERDVEHKLMRPERALFAAPTIRLGERIEHESLELSVFSLGYLRHDFDLYDLLCAVE